MSWQSGSINPATTSPLADIGRIKNDLSVLKGVLGGTQDADVPFTPYAWPSARIVGDFSNATLSNRVMFQTSVANGDTSVGAIPNGTSVNANFSANSSADPTNASRARLSMTGVDARLSSDATGTGTYLPMTFHTGGAERLRIDTSGKVGIGANGASAVPNASLHVRNSTNALIKSEGASGYGGFYAMGSGTNASYIFLGNVTNGEKARLTNDGTNDALYVATGNAATQRLYIGSAGTLHIDPNGGLGYGIGAGGTVTQSTSKSTAVTLNKPCGQITMNNAALAAGASVAFNLNNSLLATSDGLVVCPVSIGNYRVEVAAISAGVAQIRVTNITAGSLSEALIINFAIIRGATS